MPYGIQTWPSPLLIAVNKIGLGGMFKKQILVAEYGTRRWGKEESGRHWTRKTMGWSLGLGYRFGVLWAFQHKIFFPRSQSLWQASDHHPNPSHSPSPRYFQSSHGEILKLCRRKEKWEEELSLEEDRGSCKVFLVPSQFTTHPSLGFSCTISLIPHPHSAIPFYFCTLFHSHVIYVNATNGTQHLYHP